jgi:cyclohexa-1,5-dienecarbonyl-CoA hydratase
MAAETKLRYSKLMVTMQVPIARVILANPPVNVIDMPMMDELLAALEQIEAQSDISAVIFAGSDQAFSAGVDIGAHTLENVRGMLAKFHSVIRAVISSKKVTVAVVRGNCLGGGAELAAVCDIVFTSDNATWGFPEISLGCFPPVAAAMLAALVGQKHAAELILTGRQITGEEAMRIGLANEALPEDELSEMVDETAERLSQLSPASLAVTKKALYAWDSAHVDKGLQRAEQIYIEELMPLDDAQEGIRAWLEKRKPKWTGR